MTGVWTRKRLWFWLALMLSLAVLSCGGGDAAGDGANAPAASPNATGELSADELENGLGPIRNVALGELDAALAQQGENVFTLKCSACHKLTERYVGPAIGDVLSRRTPAYVMNMMLNPAEMVERHPEARKLLAEYMTPMPNQNMTQEEARAVLEYLRSINNEQ